MAVKWLDDYLARHNAVPSYECIRRLSRHYASLGLTKVAETIVTNMCQRFNLPLKVWLFYPAIRALAERLDNPLRCLRDISALLLRINAPPSPQVFAYYLSSALTQCDHDSFYSDIVSPMRGVFPGTPIATDDSCTMIFRQLRHRGLIGALAAQEFLFRMPDFVQLTPTAAHLDIVIAQLCDLAAETPPMLQVVIETVAKAKERFDLHPSAAALNHLVRIYANADCIEQALEIIDHLVQHPHAATVLTAKTFVPVIEFYIRHTDRTALNQLVNITMPELNLYPDSNTKRLIAATLLNV
jgi:hypothetical protein